MATAKPISATKSPLNLKGRYWERFERNGKAFLWGTAVFSIAYLFWIEPFLFSAWRSTQVVGEFKIKSEMERRDKWGNVHDSEDRTSVFVGDRVNADFTVPGVFKDADGREQTIAYPFRVQKTRQGEILFSPLVRRLAPVTWANRKPQKIVPPWNELLVTWANLKKDWADFEKAHPLRAGASLAKGKAGGKGKGALTGARRGLKPRGAKRP